MNGLVLLTRGTFLLSGLIEQSNFRPPHNFTLGGTSIELHIFIVEVIHSKKSHVNQLGFNYFKALRSINLFEYLKALGDG